MRKSTGCSTNWAGCCELRDLTAVGRALLDVHAQPARLQRALVDARTFLSSSARWAWDGLADALTSESGRNLVASITDAGARSAVQALLGLPR